MGRIARWRWRVRLDWDSQFFGVPMGRIEYVCRVRPGVIADRC